MNDQITLTRGELVAAFLRWNEDVQAGKASDPEEIAEMTPQELSEDLARSLIEYVDEVRKAGADA